MSTTRRRAEYKLHYFNLKGRAELIRVILACKLRKLTFFFWFNNYFKIIKLASWNLLISDAKVPYDDIRYEQQEWLPLKDSKL